MTLRERFNDIQKRQAEGVEAMKGILEAADTEKRDLTEAEEADFAYLDKEVERLKKDEARTAKLINDEDLMNEPQRRVAIHNPNPPTTPPEEFRDFGEFIHSVRFNPADRRLQDLYHSGEEQREQSMGTGTEGGFMVPNQFVGVLRSVEQQDGIFRPRSTVIPAGSPPDATITMPVLDQSAGENMYGGVEVQWIAEGATKPATDAAIKEFSLTPKEVAAHVVITDKLLRNWPACQSVVGGLLRKAIVASEDTAFMNGTGVGQPQGVMSSGAVINYSRATASTIALADVEGMYARLKMDGRPVWIASQTTLPQLMAMVDAGSNRVWYPNNDDGGLPGTLMGIPIVLNDRAPALGSTGDLMLVDLAYYMIKDGSGPFLATSPHVHFTANKTVLKVFWNVDGQSWLNDPIPLEGSTANTVSPYIVLN